MYWLDVGEMRNPQISLSLFAFFPRSTGILCPAPWIHPHQPDDTTQSLNAIISSLTFVNKHFQFQDSSSHIILRESPARTVTINSIAAAPTLT